MTYVYWILAVPTGLLAVLVIALTLGGRPLSPSTPLWLSLLTASAVLGLLAWGYSICTADSKPGLAVLIVVVSWIVFFATMLINGLLHQKTWN